MKGKKSVLVTTPSWLPSMQAQGTVWAIAAGANKATKANDMNKEKQRITRNLRLLKHFIAAVGTSLQAPAVNARPYSFICLTMACNPLLRVGLRWLCSPI